MSKYQAQNIKVLSGLEGVRVRPAMYIGSTDIHGFHHLLWEVLDNAVDEALAGYANKIIVTLHEDGSASCEDNGRGIPVDIHPEEGIPGLELVMTRLHAGAKFDHGVYKISGGLHGVGVSVVNALSEWLIAEVYKDGKIYRQTYKRGIPEGPVKVVGKTKKQGTFVRFKPDPEIFGEETSFDLDIVKRRVQELAYLNPEITFYLIDERIGYEEKFRYKGGIIELVKSLNEKRKPIHNKIIYINREKDQICVEVAFQYNSGYTENIYSYVNNIHTKEGGTHVIGFRAALTKAINRYISEANLPKNLKIKVEGEDVREGLCAVISLKVPDPQFEGQTKMKLGNSEVKPVVESICYEGILKFLQENPSEARRIVEKVVTSAKAREASRKARELVRKKSEIDDYIVAGKLADCSEKNPEKRELFIVEGDSAGGSAKQARDRRFQAILPLRGKILNVEKANIEKMLSSQEIKRLIAAIGAGIGAKDFNPDKCRYRKIIIMTDADIDGAHIRTLLLTFFYRQMPEIIERGWLYIAQPPLYRVVDGKKEVYLKDDSELDKYLLKRIEKKVKFFFDKEGKNVSPSLSSAEFFYLCSEIDRQIINLFKKEYPPLLLILLLMKEFFSFKDFENKEKMEELARELKNRGYKSVEIKRDGKYYKIEGKGEGDFFPSFSISSEILLEREYRRLINLFKKIKDWIYYPLIIKFGEETRQWKEWIFNISEIINFLREEARKGLFIQRYKGLGEMNFRQLWETTMNPEKRVLKQVSIEDAEKADELFNVLMGENVEPRREFIYQHALEYRELDI